MMKKTNPIKLLSLCTSIVLASSFLSACQTTNALDANSTEGKLDNSLMQSKQAKQELQNALNNQLRSNFKYKTDVKISNSKRLMSLLKASPEQLANVDNKKDYCNETHDKAYAALLKQVDQTGEDIFDDKYAQKLEDIKQDFLTCEQEYDSWYDDYYNNGSDAEYMPEYDDQHTAKDLKKAQLLNAYLLEPMDISITGSYQPLAGKVTFLPAFSYQHRNILARINQPIYIDLKKGDIYFWAANIAGTNAKYIDDKLGAKWHNKWLKLTLNDGSLPKNIGKDLIAAYLKALKVSYEQEPVEGFNYISDTNLLNKLDYLTNNQTNVIAGSNKIISRIHDSETTHKNAHVFAKTFYESIIQKHPQLITNTDDTESFKEMKFDSLTFLKLFLKGIHSEVEDYENPSAVEVINEVENGDVINYEAYYGLRRNNKIAWSHYNINMSDTADEEAMMVDVLTQFDYRPIGKRLFNNLPVEVQTPTSENTIDLRMYSKELLAHYEQGGGTSIGKMGYGFYKMMQEAKKSNREVSDKNFEIEETTDVDTNTIESDVIIESDVEMSTDPLKEKQTIEPEIEPEVIEKNE